MPYKECRKRRQFKKAYMPAWNEPIPVILHDCGLLKALLARLGIPLRFAFHPSNWRKKFPDRVPSDGVADYRGGISRLSGC
ncbi:Uncharacterized protein HZ326_23488 [Fusarium oxysporum f. sp. albedinis]|nr:Uncharacterized protein HZ326_23488 [Fusarium oxysporum f. sp. albedinis]